MSKIFISHSSCDNAKALAVAQWLKDQGWADHFLDITPTRGLVPGKRWQAELRAATDRCEAILCLISPAWCDSKWCLAEFLWAKQLGKAMFGVIVESTPRDSIPKELTGEWQLCNIAFGEEQQTFEVCQDPVVPRTQVTLSRAGLANLKQGLEQTGLNPSYFPWPPPHDPNRRPYRGLKALEADDAAVFFGREAPLIRALDTLRRMAESPGQLLVILGASGSGKSSFLRAGLWPRLKRDDRHFLPIPVIRPERAALSGQSGFLESLKKTFHEYKAPKTRARLRDALVKPDGLVEFLIEIQTLAQKRLGPDAAPPTIVICVDQVEELFGKESGEADIFLNLLGSLIRRSENLEPNAAHPVPRVLVLAAIRSDSYERLQAASALSGIKQTPFNLPPLAPAEYKMVIEGPAARSMDAGHKLTIEAALTTQLLQDAEGADALPLLAFILERLLIGYGDDGELLLKEYESLGGLQGSIEAAVNEAWNNPGQDPVIPSDEATRRALLHRVFPYLVMLEHEADKPKRRVATWSGLPLETHPLLERLVAARLLLKDRRKPEDAQEDVVVEVAHEALIRHWTLLKSWVDANREFLAWQQRLNTNRKRWEEKGHPVDLLLRGLPLREAEKWVKKQPDAFSPDDHAYVIASQSRRFKERAVAVIGSGLVLWVLGATTWLWQKGYDLDQAALKIQSLVMNIHVLPQMVQIPAGAFRMGDVEKLEDLWRNPVHVVTIQPFAIGKYEVTFEEYDRFAIAEGKPLPDDQAWGRGQRPVITVSWDDAKAYANWLSVQTGKRYRLPTESEWEYVARTGAKQEEWAGTSDKAQLGTYAVFIDNSDNRTAEVGTKNANGFGLHDLSGNVSEWVEDCAHETYRQAPTDGSAWLDADGGECGKRVFRGGAWLGTPELLRASNRLRYNSDNRHNFLGFRLVQDVAK
ncbi:MAG: SUMF1/EgtB/PvdO family nonheme iron enzyme [Nitrospira sp.]|nr:SUMF1/EgtB/PvdO family nonheme iron enzyme [Nitrospira sp.]